MTIENKNFLSPLNFRFILQRAPNVNFFLTGVNIPGIFLQRVDANNPLIRIPYTGDHLIYEELKIEFLVDENLKNYMEIYNWINGAGKREFEEHRKLNENKKPTNEGIRSDITLIILTSHNNPNFEITFTDAYPTSISGISLTTKDSDVNYVTAYAEFAYVSYYIKKVT